MSQPKRIIIDGEVLVSPHFSGIGHYTLEIMRALDRQLDTDKRYTVSVITYIKNIKKMREYRFKNIKILPSPFSLRIANGLKTRQLQPPLDIFFGKGIYLFPNFSSWPLMCSKSLPFIYDMSFELYSQYTDPRNQVFLSQQVALSTKRATYIVTISENAKSEIAAFYNFDQSKIGVYYPSVDTSHFYKRSSLEVKAVQKKYALPSRYMLFIGNIEPRKNLKNLLLAYATLPKPIRSSLPLVLVGANGWQNDEIFELISELRRQGNSIIMPDKYVIDADLPAVYTGATLFVYPSEYEGFGIPPLEAMACGVPVILASNSSLPEAAGDAALYVDALSVNEISAAITKLSANTKLMSDFRKKGYQQIKKFSWDKSAVKLLADIEEL